MARSALRRGLLPSSAGLTLLLVTATCGESVDRRDRPLGTRTDAVEACAPTGAHGKHAASGIGCQVCHPCGGAIQLGDFAYPGGTTTATGTLVSGSGTTPTACAGGCHAVGGTGQVVTWTIPGPLECTGCHTLPANHPALETATPLRADCLVCHDVSRHTTGTVVFAGHPESWMDQAGPNFHAFSANRGLSACQSCHAQDLTGGLTHRACAECHDLGLPAGAASWTVNCVMCHGGTDDPTGAPPKATWGNGGDAVRIGAHTAHVQATAISPAFDCAVCHVTPPDAFAAGHIDAPIADVVFNGFALPAPTEPPTDPPAWSRSTATCSNTYCHGGFRNGNTANLPLWTGENQAFCGSCHGLPPSGTHPTVGNDMTVCTVCHGKTVDTAGHVIAPAAGGKHLNGLIEASGHDGAWRDPGSANFHAYSANRGLAGCTSCHGADLSGGTSGVACAQCHGSSWQTSCTMCHGGAANASGAPPKATWGNAGDLVRVGAHSAHVTSKLATPFDCAVCHPKPSSAFSPGHVDSATATVTFSGAAVSGTWNRAAATCANTYCHGNYSGVFTYAVWDSGLEESVLRYAGYAGNRATPLWTDGPMTCGSCHGNPPRNGYWHSGRHSNLGDGNDCELCHSNASGRGVGVAITDPTLHVNGYVNVRPKWGIRCRYCH